MDGETPSRSDLLLDARALSGDWPIPPDKRREILERAVALAELEADGAKTTPRTRLRAIMVLIAASRASTEQQRVDLIRQKLEGKSGPDEVDTRLALLGEAEEVVKRKANDGG